MGDAVIGILKQLANLSQEEKRKPQGGRFGARVNEQRTVEFRVSTSGNVAGEKLELQILDNERGVLTLSELGMPDTIRQTIHDIVKRPSGLLIVCGPPDSGKTTTLHACLGEIDRYQMNALALENPVEHRVDNVTHAEISPIAGKTVATELPAILRQGVDVLCIGEATDGETATLACQTAKDGLMVLTSVEATDTAAAVGTLLEMGVKPSLIRSTLKGVLAQRLVRVLCRRCRVRYKPDPDMLYRANLPGDQIKYFYRPPKPAVLEKDERMSDVCEYCRGIGYRGRTGIFELMIINDQIHDLIRNDADLTSIKQEAIKHGMKRLQEEALRLVSKGTTSIDEVIRVCN
jgi:general secretion pathway protein E